MPAPRLPHEPDRPKPARRRFPFEVTTEPMGDGRDIHYYEWPDDDAAGDQGDQRDRATPPADPEDSQR